MARKTAADAKMSALNKALRDMFKGLQTRPIPSRLRSVVDQLDEGSDDEDQLKKSG